MAAEPDDTPTSAEDFHETVQGYLAGLMTAMTALGFPDAEIVIISRARSHVDPTKWVYAFGGQVNEWEGETGTDTTLEMLDHARDRVAARREEIDENG